MTDLHTDKVTLAALRDGALAEDRAAAVRAHLAQCPACARSAAALDEVAARLATASAHDPAFLRAVQQRIDARAVPSPTRRWMPLLTALPAAAIVVLGLRLGAPPPDDAPRPEQLTARGDAAGLVPAAVLVDVGEGPRPLRPGDVLDGARPVRLAVRVDPGAPAAGFLAVYARDAASRVTWISPRWIEPGDQPTTVSLAGDVRGEGPSGVELDAVARGRLDVGLLVFDRATAVAPFDDRLERGWRPAPGDLPGLVAVQAIAVEVR